VLLASKSREIASQRRQISVPNTLRRINEKAGSAVIRICTGRRNKCSKEFLKGVVNFQTRSPKIPGIEPFLTPHPVNATLCFRDGYTIFSPYG
jgi:hypothetical protein